jgi:hypothetical protein
MTLMGIALPVLMNGVSVATNCAEVARRRTEAAGLAESQLNDIIARGNWSSDAGDFGPDWPDYHWQSTVGSWTQIGLDQIDVHVTWKGRGGDREVVVSTLVYNNNNANTSTTGSTGTSATSGTGSGASGSKAASGGGK